MNVAKEAELFIIGLLYESPELLFDAGQLSKECRGALTVHQIGAICARLYRKGFIERHKVILHGYQTRYGASETIVSDPDGNDANALYAHLTQLLL